MVDQLAQEYSAAGKPVAFIEQHVDFPLGRKDRFDRSFPGAPYAYLPLMMINGGNWCSGYIPSGAYAILKTQLDAQLARTPLAALSAYFERIDNRIRFHIRLKNLSGLLLSTENSTTLFGYAYEESDSYMFGWEQDTRSIARGLASQAVSALADGQEASYVLETENLNGVKDWQNIRLVVLADYRPAGNSGGFDILQAAEAQPKPLADRRLYLPLLEKQ